MKKYEKVIRWVGIAICEIFTVYTIIILCLNGQQNRLPLAIGTIFMVLIPEFIERLFRCKINTAFYVFGLIYTIEPMLGQCHNFYYLISWWDKFLHITGGVMFAILGLFLCTLMNGTAKRRLLTGLFALCFSMALSMCWEFIEFSCDRFLGTDMQADTVITSIYSYKLDDALGEVESIDDIKEVTVNGKDLGFGGYLEIGLIDTMMDMFLETLGGLAIVIFYWIDKGKHSVFILNKDLKQSCSC